MTVESMHASCLRCVGLPHRDKLVITDREVGVTTDTFRARSEFPNPGNVLRPGQYAKVRAATSVQRGALLVP